MIGDNCNIVIVGCRTSTHTGDVVIRTEIYASGTDTIVLGSASCTSND
jgi:hypothetical protein